MSVDMYKRVTESIGYINMIKGLDEIFPNNYEILKVIPSDDDTSYDFSTIMNIGNMEGLDIGTEGSGNSHQFQSGCGTVGIGVPINNGLIILPSGKRGDSLSRIIKDVNFKFGASANDIEDIKEYFLKLKEYLESVDKLD